MRKSPHLGIFDALETDESGCQFPDIAPTGTFFLFALMCIPYLLIMWKLVPETTGKSLEEIERWWTGK